MKQECSPIEVRKISKLKKSTVYSYLTIFEEIGLIEKTILGKYQEDGSSFNISGTDRLKNFLKDIDKFIEAIIR